MPSNTVVELSDSWENKHKKQYNENKKTKQNKKQCNNKLKEIR